MGCFFLTPWHNLSVAIAILVFACAFLASLALVGLVKKYAQRWKLVDVPAERKVHTSITPRGAGIGIFLSVLVAYACGWMLVRHFSSEYPAWAKFASILESPSRELLVVMAGGLIIFLTGLFDDMYDLSPWVKLALESAVALLLIYFDIRITLFVKNYLFSVVVTWFWIILITNSFNLLDNMDGLSGGVAFISGGIFLVVAVQTGQWMIAFMLIGFLGAILGFLCYNFPPATIFMGDSGSLFLGYMMASLTICTTFYQKASVFPIALPIVLLAVPLFDTGTVAYIRIKAGSPLFRGDKRHFSHRLTHLGMSSKNAVLTIYLVTFATGLSALLLYHVDLFGALVILVQMLGMLSIIHILEQSGNEEK